MADVVDMPTMAEGKKNKRQVNGAQIFYEISSISHNQILIYCQFGYR